MFFKRIASFCWIVFTALYFSVSIAQAETYVLHTGKSEIVIRVYKGGTLKALGHNHIISTSNITGTVNWNNSNLQETDFELVIPVDSFQVDDLELRKQAGKGYAKDVSDSARKGTRKNMLGRKVLDALNFPQIIVRSKSIKQNKASQLDVAIDVEIHGISNIITVPVELEQSADVISVKGEFSMLQSDYDIKPLSAAFGAIVVNDRINIRFLLVAEKKHQTQKLPRK